ncbi:hypothetical protein GCM10010430_44110 [Kitasatospora cystarginea]|uniref:Uncharacterized protein n=1 Tax=Kitasatospora cystarginea TaxID=58350 RepID=A0ABN3EE71_9ACTN
MSQYDARCLGGRRAQLTARRQGWGRLKNGTRVFDAGGTLGPDGQVMPAMHERAVTA